MKRISIALTVGLGFAATQGCMAESGDVMDVGSVEQNVCSDEGLTSLYAELAVAMATEFGELNATKYLTKQSNKYGWGRDAIVLNSTGQNVCNTSGCAKTEMILALQDPAINPGVDPYYFNADNFRSKMIAHFDQQKSIEFSLNQNDPCALPAAHTLTHVGTKDLGNVCGDHHEFAVNWAGGSGSGGGFQVALEAEQYSYINRNNSNHNWTVSGGSMTIGPDWNWAWTSNVSGTSPSVVYNVNFPSSGTYKVWVLGMGYNASNDSAYVGIDNYTNGQVLDFPENGSYGWVAGDIQVNSAGSHNVHLFAREDGFFADKIVINQSSSPPSSSGGGSSSSCGKSTANFVNRLYAFGYGNSVSRAALDFRNTSGTILVDPEMITDPSGGGSSGSQSCGAPPSGGSDKLLIPYSAAMENTCCWQAYVQKSYKRYATKYLMCKN